MTTDNGDHAQRTDPQQPGRNDIDLEVDLARAWAEWRQQQAVRAMLARDGRRADDWPL